MRPTVVEDTLAAVADYDMGNAVLAEMHSHDLDIDGPEMLATLGAILGSTLIAMKASGRCGAEHIPGLLDAVVKHAEVHIKAADHDHLTYAGTA